jgi:hypothetical protein
LHLLTHLNATSLTHQPTARSRSLKKNTAGGA